MRSYVSSDAILLTEYIHLWHLKNAGDICGDENIAFVIQKLSISCELLFLFPIRNNNAQIKSVIV